MLPEWQAHIDDLLERYRQQRDQLGELRRAADEATATVTAEDEMIKVTVGPHGRLAGLEFNPRVYRRLSPSELAAAVLAAVDEARSQADGKVRAALTPVRPPDRAEPAADSAAAGGAGSGPGPGPLDLAESLPERPEDLDAFRERHGSPAGPSDS